jgi:hypothetical protein
MIAYLGANTEKTYTVDVSSTNYGSTTAGLTALATAASSASSSDSSIIAVISGNIVHDEEEIIEVTPTSNPLDNATLDHVDCIDEENYKTIHLVHPPKKCSVDHDTKIN